MQVSLDTEPGCSVVLLGAPHAVHAKSPSPGLNSPTAHGVHRFVVTLREKPGEHWHDARAGEAVVAVLVFAAGHAVHSVFSCDSL